MVAGVRDEKAAAIDTTMQHCSDCSSRCVSLTHNQRRTLEHQGGGASEDNPSVCKKRGFSEGGSNRGTLAGVQEEEPARGVERDATIYHALGIISG